MATRRRRSVFRRIIHPSDFSRASRPAFRKALGLARDGRAQLTIMHVLPVLPMLPDIYVAATTYNELLQGQRVAAQKELDRLVREAKAAGIRTQGLLVDVGVAAERITRLAKSRRADLIVMGTHGRTGVRRALMGSVAARVLTMAPCPVLTVSRMRGRDRGAAMIRRILSASDFSPASRPAFAKAVDLARATRAELTVAHVLTPPLPVLIDGSMSPQAWRAMNTAARRDGQRQLEGLVSRAKRAGVRARALLLEGVAAERIVRAATSRHADMIVMGTHGRTGFARLLAGSVANRVISQARCPVLTIPGR